MQLITVLEQTPRFLKSLEALSPYLRSIDFGRMRSWMPGSRASTPWPMVAGAFGVGIIAGAAAALMLAPKSGRELRAQLKTKLGALAAQTRSAIPLSRESNGKGGEVVEIDASAQPEVSAGSEPSA